MFRNFTLTLVALVLTLGSKAQDTLKLINGKEKIVVVNYETPEYVMYQKIKKGDINQLGKQKSKSKDYIYSIAYFYDGNPDSTQKISQVYKVDSIMENYFSVPEMRNFLDGKNQARKNYKGRWWYVYGGLVAGTTGAAISPLSVWGWLPPAGYTFAASSFVVKPLLKADQQERFNNLHFNAGYKEQARKMNAKYSAIGSIVGMVLGTILFDNTTILQDITSKF